MNPPDARDVLAARGKHDGHTRVQRGQMVHCSCGTTVKVRVVKPRLAVVLADGFISWRGNDPERAAEVASRHEGAYVVDTGTKVP